MTFYPSYALHLSQGDHRAFLKQLDLWMTFDLWRGRFDNMLAILAALGLVLRTRHYNLSWPGLALVNRPGASSIYSAEKAHKARFDNFVMLVWGQGSMFNIAAVSLPVQ